MKILHVLAQQPTRTGSGVYFSSVVGGLQSLGWDQRALFAFQKDNPFTLLPPEQQYPVEFQTPELPFPIVGMSDVMPYENTVYSEMTPLMIQQWLQAFRSKLEQAKQEFSPDLIFTHHLWMLTSLVLDIFPDTKVAAICHNTDLRQAKQHPAMQQAYVHQLDRLDRVFSLSDLQISEISETFSIPKEKIHTVGGGFNQEIFYPLPKQQRHQSDQIRLVYSGKMDESKGIYPLIQAFHPLRQKYPHLTLDMIGSPNPENAKRLEKEIGNQKGIRVYDVENQQKLGDVLRTKDIFIMPSFFEGLGLMAIESLATGLWVVASEIPGLMSLLGDELNNSGVIHYVKLPRIVDTDKAVAEDLPAFIHRLEHALELQIEKVERGEGISDETMEKIHHHSWKHLVKNIDKELRRIALS